MFQKLFIFLEFLFVYGKCLADIHPTPGQNINCKNKYTLFNVLFLWKLMLKSNSLLSNLDLFSTMNRCCGTFHERWQINHQHVACFLHSSDNNVFCFSWKAQTYKDKITKNGDNSNKTLEAESISEKAKF